MNEYSDLKEVENFGQPFILVPKDYDTNRYWERVDRNIGFITRSEQEALSYSTVGIAGCSGMGGLLAATMLRAGIGCIKIADLEVFDSSNLNRQFAARQESIGLPKVLETARMLREIATGTCIHVYPQGITADSVNDFGLGCDVVADELEFWALGARMQLHDAISARTTILNGNSVGMGTRLFRFTATSAWKMGDLLGMSTPQAMALEEKLRAKTASPEEIRYAQESVLEGLVPELPEYSAEIDKFSTRAQVSERLFDEGRAPILASNPPMATGFLANHILLELLRHKSPLRRKVQYPPDMPGYLYFDAALMRTEVRKTIWWKKRKEPR